MGTNGIMIAAPSSGTGKTTVSTGIMKALTDLGFKVQPFKVGPDYIDPGFHRLATGNKSYNLDTVMGNSNTVKEIYYHNSAGKDISIVEGVMGLFDGKSWDSNKGSSFDISLILNLPVIMVIDISASGRSAAALVQGFKSFDRRLKLKGIILNRGGSDFHCNMVENAIEKITGIKVVGCIKKDKTLKIDSRYLGLVTTAENKMDKNYLNNISSIIKNNIDINEIIKIGSSNVPDKKYKPVIYNYKIKEKCKIGIAYNKAFTFYYNENLELLEKYGAKIVYFDPFKDAFPDVDGIYIGGGYPELYAKELSSNKQLLLQIKGKIEDGMPVFAECGGYMYLSRSINIDGKEYSMVGSIPAKTNMETLSLGYREIRPASEIPFLKNNERIIGHEFHYSRIVFDEGHDEAYKFQNGNSDGYAYKELVAGYAHLYFPSNQNFAKRFVKSSTDYRKSRTVE
ncbi:cobyrinate a,c-diamide synthase [Ferroplasma sp.]|uniref:cobyrinate a,c-diamide synthase n=1 Tax=Ferroplasma sp. TaxID=2591003 RepID=UPI00307EC49A